MLSTLRNGLARLPDVWKNRVLAILCIVITVVILIAGLYPFTLNPVNKVVWLENGNGIRFYGKGIVFSREPLVIQRTTSGNASVTIEFLVRPRKEVSNRVPCILTLFSNNQPKQFMFGQWKKELIIRVPAVKSNGTKYYREVAVGNALIKETTYLIAITSSQEETVVYVNGKPEGRFPHYSLVPDNYVLSGHIILGNSSDGNNFWDGTFTGLSIYDSALNSSDIQNHYTAWMQSRQMPYSVGTRPIALYLFDEHVGEQIHDHSGLQNNLLMPKSFHPLRRIVLEMPVRDQWFRRSNLMDVAINILGFVPFGFFLSAWLLRVKNIYAPRAYGITVFIGFCLSLAIELTQVYIPGRDSSLLDVISNTLGTIAGVSLIICALPALQKERSLYDKHA